MLFDQNKNNTHWLATISLMIMAVFYFTNWTLYYFKLGGPESTLYYAITCIMGLFFVFLRPNTLGYLFSEPLFYWFLVYALSSILWVVLIDGAYFRDDDRSWRMRFLMMLFFSACYVLALGVDLKRLVIVWFGCIVFSAICFWIDFLIPFTFIPADDPLSNPGRASGFFMNANLAGTSVVLMSIAVMPFVKMQWRIALIFIMGVAVFPTFSRSAMVLAILISIAWIWSGYFNKKALFFLFIFVAPAAILVGSNLFFQGISSTEINQENILSRLEFFETLGESADDSSAQERRYLVNYGWQKFTESPFVGYGMGKLYQFSPEWGFPSYPHNIYLMLLFEQGIWGGILYLSFLGIILSKGVQLFRRSVNREQTDLGLVMILIAIYYAFIGFFEHNILLQAIGIFILATFFAKAHQMMRS